MTSYSEELQSTIIGNLARGGVVLFYGPGGTGKTHQLINIIKEARGLTLRPLLTAYFNNVAASLDSQARGLYEMFGMMPINSVPVCKLDLLCTSIRRANPRRQKDPLWDGVSPTEEDSKRLTYSRKAWRVPMDIEESSDADLIAAIDSSKCRFMIKDCADVYSNITKCSFVAIEEVFTTPDILFYRIDKMMRKYRREDSLMGGAGLFMSGDPLQTEPIKSDFIFNIPLWEEINTKLEVYLFTTMKRFTNQEWADTLMRMRLGKPTPEDIELLKSRRFSIVQHKTNTNLTTTRAAADVINHKKLNELDADKCTIRAKDTYIRLNPRTGKYGALEYTEEPILNAREIGVLMRRHGDLNKLTNLPSELRLAVGARVIYTHNDRRRRIFNGYIGTVHSIMDSDYPTTSSNNSTGCIASIRVTFDREWARPLSEVIEHTDNEGNLPQQFTSLYQDDDEEYTIIHDLIRQDDTTVVTRDTLEIRPINARYTWDNYAVVRTSHPLELAWALTIHKRQGATIKEGGFTQIKGRMSCGQAYVGVSRYADVEDMVLDDDFDPSAIRAHPTALAFDAVMMSGGAWHPSSLQASSTQASSSNSDYYQEYDDEPTEMTEEMKNFLLV